MARFSSLVCCLFALGLGLLAFAATPAQAEGRVGIAATVNDDVITMGDLDNRVKLYMGGRLGQPTPEQLKMLQAQVLDKLIDEKLELQEAKSLSIDVPDDMIAQGFANIAQQNNSTPDEFRAKLEHAGVKLDTLRDQIRAEIAWSQVVRRKLRPQVNVSEQEIDNALQVQSRKKGKTQYHVAEILLSTEHADASKIEAEANAIYDALKKGARFSDIARQRSEAPGAALGGDIGWVTEGQLDPAIDAALAKMQTGQASPPVRGKDGFYLLFLRERRDSSDAPKPEAAADAAPADTEAVLTLKQLTIPVAAGEPGPVVAAKTARAEALAGEVNSCDDLDKAAAEFKTRTASGPQKISTLPGPIADVVRDLADNKLSAPIRTTNGVSVFMICRRETPAAPAAPAPAPEAADNSATPTPAPGTSSEEDTRNAVASEIGMTRLNQMQERYLRDLRATAFIDRRI